MDVVKALLDAGADVNAKYNQSQTALYLAKYQGQFIIDPNKLGEFYKGMTKMAEEKKEQSIANAFKLRGFSAEMYLQGEQDIYADISDAKKKDYQEIIEMLQSAGVK